MSGHNNLQQEQSSEKKWSSLNFLFYLIIVFTLICTFLLPIFFTTEKLLTPLLILIPILLLLLIYFYAKDDLSVIKISITWFLLGVALLTFSLYGEKMFDNKILASFWANFATVFISLGLINIILQLKDSKDYFAQALSELIMQDNYLRKLNKEQLEKLKKNVLEMIFANSTEFDKENSFYSYFNKNLQKYIGEPYRENYINSITVESHEEDFIIKDKVIYTAKAVGGKIQDHVRWGAVKNEVKELKEVKLRINNKEVFAWNSNDEKIKKEAQVDYNFENPEEGLNFIYKLTNVPHDGKLEVELATEYKTANYKSLTLKVINPTFGFTVILSHENDLSSKVEAYGFNSESMDCTIISTKTSTTLNYRNWLLPYSGIFIEIQPKGCIGCSITNGK